MTVRVHSGADTAASTFVIKVRPSPGTDPVRALRGALKVLGRRFGLQVLAVEHEGASGKGSTRNVGS